MNGFVVGSGPTSATWPRLRGLSTQADSVMPCAGGGSSPSCMYIAATMWNWTSGASRPSRGGQNPPAPAHPQPEILLRQRILERALLLAGVDDAGRRMVGEVQAELGRLGDHRDL